MPIYMFHCAASTRTRTCTHTHTHSHSHGKYARITGCRRYDSQAGTLSSLAFMVVQWILLIVKHTRK